MSFQKENKKRMLFMLLLGIMAFLSISMIGTNYASDIKQVDNNFIIKGDSGNLSSEKTYHRIITIDNNGKYHLIDNTNVITTDNNYDCGSVAVANVLKNKGKNISVKKLSNIAKTNKSGTNAYNLIRAVKKNNFYCEGLYIPYNKLKKNNIALLKNNGSGHYVVIRGIKNGKIYIIDSSRGKTYLSLKNFKSYYTGISLVITKNKYNKQFIENKKVLKNKLLKCNGGELVYLFPIGILGFQFTYSFKNSGKWNAMMIFKFKKLSPKTFVGGYIDTTVTFYNTKVKKKKLVSSAIEPILVLVGKPTLTLNVLTPYAYAYKYNWNIFIKDII